MGAGHRSFLARMKGAKSGSSLVLQGGRNGWASDHSCCDASRREGRKNEDGLSLGRLFFCLAEPLPPSSWLLLQSSLLFPAVARLYFLFRILHFCPVAFYYASIHSLFSLCAFYAAAFLFSFRHPLLKGIRGEGMSARQQERSPSPKCIKEILLCSFARDWI